MGRFDRYRSIIIIILIFDLYMSRQDYIQATNKAGFEKALKEGKISEEQIGFIEEEDLIWAKGNYYGAVPDNEDLTKDKDGKLQFSDRSYNPANFSGKGYKILRRNIVQERNVLTQEMMAEPNTIYEIRYDFDLSGETINVPEGCVLKFEGGSLKNGTVNFNNTELLGNVLFNTTVTGTCKNNTIYVDWFAKFENAISISENKVIVFSSKDYILSQNIKIPTSKIIGNNANIIINNVPSQLITPNNIISNKSYQIESKGDSIYIENLNIKSSVSGSYHIISFSNTNKLIVNNLNVISEDIKSSYKNSSIVPFEIRGNNVDTEINNCNFTNNSKSEFGGCLHIRAIDGNISNTTIKNCICKSSSGDEVFTILASNKENKYTVLNTFIQNCYFEDKKNDQFNAGSKISIGVVDYPYGQIYNTIFDSCKFITDCLINFLIQAAQYLEEEVIIRNSEIYVEDIKETVDSKEYYVINGKINCSNSIIKLYQFPSRYDIDIIDQNSKVSDSIINIDNEMGVLSAYGNAYIYGNNIDILKGKLFKSKCGDLINNTVKTYNSKNYELNNLYTGSTTDNINYISNNYFKSVNKEIINFIQGSSKNKYIELSNNVFNNYIINDYSAVTEKSRTLDNLFINSTNIFSNYVNSDDIVISTEDKGYNIFNPEINKPLWAKQEIDNIVWVDSEGNPADALKKGTTSQRPTGVQPGFHYFDTDLGHDMVWDGQEWYDPTNKDEFSDLYKIMYNQHASVSVSSNVPGNIIEKGVPKAVTLSWNYIFNGASTTPDTLQLKSGQDVLVGDKGTKTYIDNIQDTKTYQVVSIMKGVTKTAGITINAYYPIYYGGSSKTTLTSDDVLAFTKHGSIKSNPSGSYNFQVDAGEYAWICVPAGMVINKVTSNGFGVPIEPLATVAVTGKGNYNCYRSSETFTSGMFSCVVG